MSSATLGKAGIWRRAALSCQDDSVKAGSLTIWPPLSADSWAQRPTQVQLAD